MSDLARENSTQENAGRLARRRDKKPIAHQHEKANAHEKGSVDPPVDREQMVIDTPASAGSFQQWDEGP